MTILSFSFRLAISTVIFFGIWIVCVWPVLAKNPSVEIIALKHRLASDIAPLLQPILEKKGGTLVADNNRIVVTCPDDFKEEFDSLIQKLDIPYRLLRLSLSTSPSDFQTDAGSEANQSDTVHEHKMSTKTHVKSWIDFSVLEGQKSQIYVNDTEPKMEHVVIAGKKYLSVILRDTQESATAIASLRPQVLNGRAMIEWLWLPGAEKLFSATSAYVLGEKMLVSQPTGQWFPVLPVQSGDESHHRPSKTYKTLRKSPITQIWLKVEIDRPSPSQTVSQPKN